MSMNALFLLVLNLCELCAGGCQVNSSIWWRHSLVAPWPVPNYTSWWQSHTGVSSLQKATKLCRCWIRVALHAATKPTRSSATAQAAHDVDVAAHSLSLLSNASPAYNLRPLNSPMHYVVIYLFISVCINAALRSLHSHTPPLFQVELVKDGWE